jgi:hypothetical protein
MRTAIIAIAALLLTIGSNPAQSRDSRHQTHETHDTQPGSTALPTAAKTTATKGQFRVRHCTGTVCQWR